MFSDRAGTVATAAETAARIAPGDGIVVHCRPLTVLATGTGDLGPMAAALTDLVDELVADPELAFGPVAAGLQQFVVAHQPSGVAAVLDLPADPIAFLFDQAVAAGDHATSRADGRAGWTTVFIEGRNLTLTVGDGDDEPVVPWTLLHAGTVPGTTAQVLLTSNEATPPADHSPVETPVEDLAPLAAGIDVESDVEIEVEPSTGFEATPEPIGSLWDDEPVAAAPIDELPVDELPVDKASVEGNPVEGTSVDEVEIEAGPIDDEAVTAGAFAALLDRDDDADGLPLWTRPDPEIDEAQPAPTAEEQAQPEPEPEPVAIDLTEPSEPESEPEPEPAAIDLTDAPEPVLSEVDLTATAPLPAGLSVAMPESSEPLWSWPPPSTGPDPSTPEPAPAASAGDDLGVLAERLDDHRDALLRPEPAGERPPSTLGPVDLDRPPTDVDDLPAPARLGHEAPPIGGPPPMPPGPGDLAPPPSPISETPPMPTAPPSGVQSGLPPMPPPPSGVQSGLPPMPPPASAVDSGLPPMPPPPSGVQSGLPPMPPPPSAVESGLPPMPPPPSGVQSGTPPMPPPPSGLPIAGPPPLPDGAAPPVDQRAEPADRTEAP